MNNAAENNDADSTAVNVRFMLFMSTLSRATLFINFLLFSLYSLLYPVILSCNDAMRFLLR